MRFYFLDFELTLFVFITSTFFVLFYPHWYPFYFSLTKSWKEKKWIGCLSGRPGSLKLLLAARIVCAVSFVFLLAEAFLLFKLYQLSLDVRKFTIPEYPINSFHGSGLVFPSGGDVYLALTYANIHLIRNHLHSKIPIEIFYMGTKEITASCEELFHQHFENVKFRDATQETLVNSSAQDLPIFRIQQGEQGSNYQIKIYSLLKSSFEEVILMDPDSFIVTVPEKIFTNNVYLTSGNIFWPDISKPNSISEFFSPIMGMSRKAISETESGQMVLHKQRNWNSLMLSWFLNSYHSIVYWFLHGDKDTYNFAFTHSGNTFTQPSKEPTFLGVMKNTRFIRTAFLQSMPDSQNPFSVHIVGSSWKTKLHEGKLSLLWSHQLVWDSTKVSPQMVDQFLRVGYDTENPMQGVFVNPVSESLHAFGGIIIEGIKQYRSFSCFSSENPF